MKFLKNFEEFIINEGLEHEHRLNPIITEVLNKQIANELESSQIYRSMSAWLDDKGWINGSELFFRYADEEFQHMRDIYKYLYQKNSRAIVPTCNPVPIDYPGVRELVESALSHEIKVTADWTNIANLAKEYADHDTYSFALKFINEQREEEEKMRNILFKMNLEMPNWKIDELFGEYL